MTGIDLEINGKFPGPVAEAFYHDRTYFSAIMGPLGSGKTNTAILKALNLAAEQEPNSQRIRPSRLIIIRNTYTDLEATTIRDWRQLTGPMAPVRMGIPPTQALTWQLPDGTTVDLDVLFLALDREDHIRKLRGTQASFVWLNELKELPKAVVDMATRPLGRYPSPALGGVPCTREQMMGDFNAPDEDHWVVPLMASPPPDYKFFIQPGGVRYEHDQWVIHQKAENIRNLPPNYYEKLLQGKKHEWIRVNLANQYGSSADGKAVYDEYTPHVHCRNFDPWPDEPVYLGADFGLTPAACLAQLKSGQLRVFDEIVTENFSAEELVASLHERKATQWPGLDWGHGWGDPAGAGRAQTDKRTVFQVLQAGGLDIVPAPSNDFGLRRDAVAHRLQKLCKNGEPALIIHPRCRVLHKAMSGHYGYRRVRVLGDEKYHDVPDKTPYSHIAEALQYLCLGLGDGLLYQSTSRHWDTPINPLFGIKSNGHSRNPLRRSI